MKVIEVINNDPKIKDCIEKGSLEEAFECCGMSNYSRRFAFEIIELKIRITKLQKMLADWEEGNLRFVPTHSKEVFVLQLKYMQYYLGILELRAHHEEFILD